MRLLKRLAMRWRWHSDEARRMRAEMNLPPSMFQRAERFFHRRKGGDT